VVTEAGISSSERLIGLLSWAGKDLFTGGRLFRAGVSYERILGTFNMRASYEQASSRQVPAFHGQASYRRAMLMRVVLTFLNSRNYLSDEITCEKLPTLSHPYYLVFY
jgi:arginine exporter protein ArgO